MRMRNAEGAPHFSTTSGLFILSVKVVTKSLKLMYSSVIKIN